MVDMRHGRAHRTTSPESAAPDGTVLHKVRSLLAKAESTDFPDEAEALTAKAQELMDRHAIDRAVLAASAGTTGGRPEGRDVELDAPYAAEKFLLLSAIARANRGSAIFSPHARVGTVVGFPEDQETIELLFTSLLVQATSSMLANGSHAATRTRRYRQSFLVAFATRVGERLPEVDARVVAEADADHGGGVLPVLASRAEAVEAHVEREFPDLRTRRFVVRDRAGWGHGVDAADRAELGRHRRMGRRGVQALPGR